jgi:hypothetical protein
MTENDNPGGKDNRGEPPDLYEVFIRVTGWVYLAIGVAMLAFFLLWLRGE